MLLIEGCSKGLVQWVTKTVGDAFPAKAWSNYTSSQWCTHSISKIRTVSCSFYQNSKWRLFHFRHWEINHHSDSFVFVITETSFFKFLFLYNITKKFKNNNVNGLGMNLRKIGENLNKKIYLKNISC